MNLPKIALSALLTIFAINASASDSAFQKSNNNVETEVCYTAAKQGLGAAKRAIKTKGLNYRTFQTSVMCNGLSLPQFASKFATLRSKGIEQKDTVTVVSISALDRSVESQLCLDAGTLGERAARTKHNLKSADVQCNGKSISNFLKSFRNKKIVSNQSDRAQTKTSE